MKDLKRVSILGFAKSAISAIDYLLDHTEVKTIHVSELKVQDDFDQMEIARLEKKAYNKSVELAFEFSKNNINFIKDSDFIMLSPGIPPRAPVLKAIKEAGLSDLLGTDIDLFGMAIDAEPGEHNYVSVTGTNGKTTTTSLIAHIFDTEALGNIGTPVLSYKSLGEKTYGLVQVDFTETDKELKHETFYEDKNTPFILEISSFQAFYSTRLKAPKVSVHLNFTPDHLDWHSSLDEYREAKEKLFLVQNKDDFSILNYDDTNVRALAEKLASEERLAAGKDTRIRFFSTDSKLDWMQDSAYLDGEKLVIRKANQEHVIAEIGDLNLVGKHNYSNALAAILVADSLGLDHEIIADKLESFMAVEHRMEYVATIDGKKIYNDSKATNPESAIKSVDAFDKSIVIVGGKDKGLDLDAYLEVLAKKAAKVVAIGELRETFKEGLAAKGFKNTELAESLEDALKSALAEKESLPVILAPASSSFDMFKNFEVRGQKFKELVHKIAPATIK